MKNKHHSIFAFLYLTLFGCADSLERMPLQTQSDSEVPGHEKSELHIPMQPVEQFEIYSVPVFDSELRHIQINATIQLAHGANYPDEVLAKLPTELWTPCGSIQADVALDSMQISSPYFRTKLNDQSIEILVLGEGSAALEVTGTLAATRDSGCGIATGEIVQLTMRLQIQSHEIHGVLVGRPAICREAGQFYVSVSSSLGEGHPYDHFAPILVDENGQPIHVLNAAPNAQAGVTLRGNLGMIENAPDVLGSWISPPNPGVIEVAFEVGPPLQIDVVDAHSITRLEVEFQLGGTASGPLVLESGEEYSGGGRAANRVAPMIQKAFVGDDPLCSAPHPSWFEFETLTPEVCELAAHGPDGYTFYGTSIGQAVRFVQDGSCELELRAPGIHRGAGAEWSLISEFRNTEYLLEWDSRTN